MRPIAILLYYLPHLSVLLRSHVGSENISKNKYMNFNNIVPKLILSLGDVEIQRVDQYKVLGMYIDSKLNFKNHIELLCKKFMKFFFTFKLNNN